ncbi:response regulator transcription factor [Streptacidiphilus monticola]
MSPREREVLEHVAQGLTNESIARRLRLSPHTVDTYLRRIRAKTGTANRAQLAVLTVARTATDTATRPVPARRAPEGNSRAPSLPATPPPDRPIRRAPPHPSNWSGSCGC